MNSVWTNQLTTSVSVSYNDKRGNDKNTYDDADLNGPQIEIHQDAFLNAGNQVGTGALARLNTPDSISLSDAHIWLIRGDATYYKQGWGGGHEFRAGIWAAPSMVRETVTEQVNGGFGLQRDRFIDPSNSALGTTPFYIRTRTPVIAPGISEHDRDIAFYAPGLVDADPAAHRQPRPAGRLHQAPRRDPRHRPAEEHGGAAAGRRLRISSPRMPATSSAPATAGSTSRSTAATTS